LCFIVFALLMTSVALGDNPPGLDVAQGQPVIRILFIGNSYTYVNDLPRMLEKLASHEAKPIKADSSTLPGATLADIWKKGDALKAIQTGNWDYVVLQEHSQLGSHDYSKTTGIVEIADPADFYASARLFDAEIKKVGAKTLFYLTWARKGQFQSQPLLTDAYTSIGKELGDDVVPVGLAWENALDARPNLVLHQNDGSHPTPDGTYLTACVFYAKIYNKSPENLESVTIKTTDMANNAPEQSNPQNTGFFQQIAWQTVQQQMQGATQEATQLATATAAQ